MEYTQEATSTTSEALQLGLSRCTRFSFTPPRGEFPAFTLAQQGKDARAGLQRQKGEYEYAQDRNTADVVERPRATTFGKIRMECLIERKAITVLFTFTVRFAGTF